MNNKKEYPKVLAIAGSEPLGSAGVQADIKSVSACGSYAAGAITCIVDEDTTRVKQIFPLPVELVTGQVRSFLDDVRASAIKTGMLYTEELVRALGGVLARYRSIPLVVDPVMVDSAGTPLICPEAIAAYQTSLFPLATLITPNYREANLLLGRTFCADTDDDIRTLCRWGNAAIVKSVPHPRGLMDVFYSPSTGMKTFVKEKIDTRNVNGTGCTFSSSIAAYLSQGHSLYDAILFAEAYIDGAIREGATYRFGTGFGPVTHFYRWLRHRDGVDG